MEETRFRELDGIEKALDGSKIDEARKKLLKAYINKLKSGFPEPETLLDKIARDIDLLDLATIDGIIKIIWIHQTNPAFSSETIKASFDSAMKSAIDIKDDLCTDTAMGLIDGLVSHLNNFRQYIEDNGFFDLLDSIDTLELKIEEIHALYANFIAQDSAFYLNERLVDFLDARTWI